MRGLRGGRAFGVCAGLGLVVALSLAALATGCDGENTCSIACPTGTRFTNDGTCACEPFDAGYCGSAADCPDVFCPAQEAADACGGGQLWSTTLCGCYPLPPPDAG